MAVNINKGSILSSVNLTPMIDMVFLLLIFFLVATRFEEEERSLDVNLPQASEAMPVSARPRELFVNVDVQGRYFLGARQVNAQELESQLRQAATNNPGRQTVVIRADRHCHWQSVVNVVNLCLKAGIRDYRTTTAEPEA
jgi:biopolymer transport protein ExbD